MSHNCHFALFKMKHHRADCMYSFFGGCKKLAPSYTSLAEFCKILLLYIIFFHFVFQTW